jgi:glycosyltransferase involved in cell wall biosynthesis
MMIDTLLKRKAFDYELLICDYHREMLNRLAIEKQFGKYGCPIIERNDLDYRVLRRSDDPLDLGDSVVYFATLNPLPLPKNTKSSKMVVTVHDINFYLYADDIGHTVAANGQFESMLGFRHLQEINAQIMADSYATKSDLVNYTKIPEENIKVAYISCDEENLFPEEDKSALKSLGIYREYILFLAAIEDNKNIYRILDAFNVVAEKNSYIQLVLAGKCTDIVIKKAIAAHKYHDRIILTGYVTDDMKRKLYSGAMFLAFPSLCEGFGLPVLEAMRCGCPVVTSNTTSLPEVAGDAGILVNPRDTDEISDAFSRVIESESLREDMRQKGFVQAAKFSWNKTAEIAEGVFRKAMAI